jgi:predicted DNA-binding transcriptional regulator YafY
VLTALVAACRDRERLRFDYRAHDGTVSRRDAEPYRLVNWGRRWYLVGWDTDRADWRTYRVDRVTPVIPNGPRFAPRPLPAEDLAAYVSQGAASAAWRYRARVTVHAPAAYVAEKMPSYAGTVTAIDDGTCEVESGSDSAEQMAVWFGLLGVDFTVRDAPALATALRELSARYAKAAG